MTRYFYTDPLAAAWMDKHYGMSFVKADGAFTCVNGDIDNPHFYYSECAYIHTDSLCLLAPQIGDVVWSPGSNGDPGSGVLLEDDFDLHHHAEDRIMQRMGVAFIWPERETVG